MITFKLYLYEVWSGRFDDKWYEIHITRIAKEDDTYKLIGEFEATGDPSLFEILLASRIIV